MTPTSDPIQTLADSVRCPCLSGEVYGECCGPFHRGQAHAPTAERLMRSRYSAFAVGDAGYLLDTWHPRTRPGDLELDPALRWFRLDILGRTGGGVLDSEGTVEFEAHYRTRPATPDVSSTTGTQHENSRFTRLDGRWFYVDAV
ncbi:YchJ family protein [Herbiconiux ginsengi]|uniref:YchJ family protein n=1 Tax=Herbiconiux ginsengi TaxID=381665 RepID=UPI001FE0F7AC|nr:YchJ family metal-binding protein [Herbiconiux ginsengi]